MVNPGLTIRLFDFQEQAVLKLLDLTSKPGGKQTIVMKAPTGSGKTIILIDYVDNTWPMSTPVLPSSGSALEKEI